MGRAAKEYSSSATRVLSQPSSGPGAARGTPGIGRGDDGSRDMASYFSSWGYRHGDLSARLLETVMVLLSVAYQVTTVIRTGRRVAAHPMDCGHH